MINRILEIIALEDTFNIFSNQMSPSIYDVRFLKIKTLQNIKAYLVSLFRKVRDASVPESLYWNEAIRLERFTYRLFQEIENVKHESSGDDDVVEYYVESLMNFVNDVDIPVINEHVNYIVS